MSIPLLPIYSPVMSTAREKCRQYSGNIPPLRAVKGRRVFLDSWITASSRVGREPRRSKKKKKKTGQSRVSHPENCCFFLPPLGRESLKSPSIASQVLPSPPHTRQRSSLASEFRMLSQPTCFGDQQNNVRGQEAEIRGCSQLCFGCLSRRGLF